MGEARAGSGGAGGVRWMRAALWAAGVYNLAWGAFVVAFPLAYFRWTRMPEPNYPQIWQCLGMVVGVYGLGYIVAARDPVRHWPIVFVGLLGKIFGPAGFLFSALRGEWPWRMGWTILTNDLAWWVPFALILLHAYRAETSAARGRLTSPNVVRTEGRDLSRNMTQEISIRRATERDAPVLAELGARTFDETFAHLNTPEDMQAYTSEAFTTARLTEELADTASMFWLAEAGGEPAGYAKLYAGEAPAYVEGDRAVELSRLYVLRQWLGRGVGETLMRECVEEARRRGYRTMWLGVWERNERAQAFYRRWGFRHVGEHVFQLGSDAQTDWVMEREL